MVTWCVCGLPDIFGTQQNRFPLSFLFETICFEFIVLSGNCVFLLNM